MHQGDNCQDEATTDQAPRTKPFVFVIPGDPVPLARARVNKNNTFFNPQRSQKLVQQITVKSQYAGLQLFTGPLYLDVTFYMHIKKTTNKIPGQWHTYIPDLDNMIKWVGDLCQTDILFHDDCTICAMSAKKIYSRNTRTEFSIIPLGEYYRDGEEEHGINR